MFYLPHEQTDGELDHTQIAAPSSLVSLEQVWRSMRRTGSTSEALVFTLAADPDPVVAARADLLRRVDGLRGGAPLLAPDDGLLDPSHIGAVWALRARGVAISFALTRSDLAQAESHFSIFQALYEAHSSEMPAIDRAWFQNVFGRMAYRRHDLASARVRFAGAAQGYQRLGVAASEAVCRTNLGNVLSDMGDFTGALDAYSCALELVSGTRDSRFAAALAHANIACVHDRMGDGDAASRYVELAVELLEAGDGAHVWFNTLSLAMNIALSRGDLAEGRRRLGELEALVRGGASALQHPLQCCRAALALAEGRPEACLAALDTATATADLHSEIKAAMLRARAHTLLGNPREVVQLAGRLSEVQDTLPVLADEIMELVAAGYEALGEFGAALRVMREQVAWQQSRQDRLAQLRVADRSVELELKGAHARERVARHDAELLQHQLVRAQRLEAVGQLASGVAHDFRNLLTVVLGEADEILADPTATPSVREASQNILDAAERGSGVVQRLLAFARQSPFEPGPVDLAAVIREMQPMLSTALGSSVSLAVRTPDSPTWVYGDAGLIEQMVLNLALNSRDAMPRGGALVVEVRRAEFRSEVVVSDTGTGIPSHVLPRIFDPFFTTKGAEQGSGLGLAMVFGSAQQLDGAVRVDTVEGEGTTFTVSLRALDGPG